MNLTQFPSLKSLFSLFVLATVFNIIACKKQDLTAPEKAKPDLTVETFFKNSTNQNPAVTRVAQKFEQLNTNGHLVQDFANRYGNPVWDKSRQLKKQFTATAKGNADGNDTIIIIPVVVPNTQEVKTYIEATLSDTVTLAVHTAAEYKYLPFSKDSSAISGAEKLALRFMLLNQDVFNHSSFNIIDKRLFNGAANYTDTAKLKRKVVLTNINIATKLPNNIYDAGLLTDEICVEVTTLAAGHHCGTENYCNANGGCDNCGTYCWDYVNAETYTTCISWQDDTGMPPSTGGGSGGGGGGGTPPEDPCAVGGAINGQEPPCNTNPPPSNPGWVPIEDETPSSVFINTILTPIQRNYWNNPNNAAFVSLLNQILINSNYSHKSEMFVQSLIDYLISDTDISPAEFANYFLYTTEGRDGEYDANYWDDPALTFQQTTLPSFQNFITAFPKITLANGSIKRMPSEDVYALVGGNMYIQNRIPNPLYQNACAIRGSRALNYSGKPIDNSVASIELGGDGKNYILNAKAFNKYMNIKFGQPTYRITKSQINGDPKNIKNFLRNKNGIYNMVTSGGSFSGHVDLIIGGLCLSGSATDNIANVDFIEIWELH